MRNTAVENPPISLLARAAMAWNTGCTSAGEAAMTLRISAVAACWQRTSASSASRSTSTAARSWRRDLLCLFAAVGALRVDDIALALADSRFGPRLFDLPAKGKVRLLPHLGGALRPLSSRFRPVIGPILNACFGSI